MFCAADNNLCGKRLACRGEKGFMQAAYTARATMHRRHCGRTSLMLRSGILRRAKGHQPRAIRASFVTHPVSH